MQATPWYREERILIPLAILVAALAMIGLKALFTQEAVAEVVAKSMASPNRAATTPGAPQLAPMLNRERPPEAPLVLGYSDLNGIWRGRYEQVGDAGDFSEFRINQTGDFFTGAGATKSQALNEVAEYTIDGSIEGSTVRFTDHLVTYKFGWCEDCEYTGTVNEDYTRIELRGRCPGLCPGGTFVLERLPPDVPPTLL